MKRSLRWTFYSLSFAYVVMGLGLAGCTRDATHVKPDAIYLERTVRFAVEGDSLGAYNQPVRLRYATSLMNECYGCCDPVYYDRADWHAIRQADVRLNDIRFEYDDEASRIDADNFLASYAEFHFPESSDHRFFPGDTLAWTVQLETDIEPWEDMWDTYVLPAIYLPDLPENDAEISQSAGLTLEKEVPEGTRISIIMYRPPYTGASLYVPAITSDNPVVSIPLSASMVGDSLTLKVTQDYIYEATTQIFIVE